MQFNGEFPCRGYEKENILHLIRVSAWNSVSRAGTVMKGETWGKARTGPGASQGLSHLAEDREVWQGYNQSIILLEKEWGRETG